MRGLNLQRLCLSVSLWGVCACADDPHYTMNLGSSDVSGEAMSADQLAGTEGGEMTGRATLDDPPMGGMNSSEGVWVTKPPEGQMGGDEVIGQDWIVVDLSGLGLIDPTDDSEGEPPTGEAPCVYQPELFAIEHPRAHVGRRDRHGVLWSEGESREEMSSAFHLAPARIAHLEVPTQDLRDASSVTSEITAQHKPDLDGVVLPTHVNDMPLSDRATEWSEPRCYEIGPFDERIFEAQEGGVLLSEAEAYEMYVRLIRTTLWREVDPTPHRPTVVGLRGAYPGSLRWHHNAPNQFNDAIVALWRDESGTRHVREYPVNTDTGEYDFGVDNSSSLRPNRHYPYINGWHRDYHALQIDLPSYPVRDDTNNNGHWDSERNGWLGGPEGGQDYDRLGTAHNIHAGNINGPLGDALVNVASAGCQVIPGMENWLSFLSHVWTGVGDEVDYYLIDVRDISPRFWARCDIEDGTHACPFLVNSFPYQHYGDTADSDERWHDVYSCDDANESGGEQVYVLNLPSSGTLRLSVTVEGEGIDPDIHLLEGDDARACRARGHREVDAWVPAGRYVVIVDTWVNASGDELAGAYTLNIDWSPRQ